MSGIKTVIGKYIALQTINEVKKMGGGELEYSPNDVSQMRTQRGTVYMSGLEVEGIDKGDIVLYDKARSFLVSIDGESFTMIREQDVILCE